MTWIVSKQSSQEELAERFRTLMAAPDLLQIPGAHDAMAALIAKKTGFRLFIYQARLTRRAEGCPI